MKLFNTLYYSFKFAIDFSILRSYNTPIEYFNAKKR